MTTMAPGLVVLIVEKHYSHWGLAEGSLVPLGSSFATLAPMVKHRTRDGRW